MIYVVSKNKIPPPLSVVNSQSRITINSSNPVFIMQGEVEISGTIAGTFYHVCGIAVYVDDVAINKGTGRNLCHIDCMNVYYSNGNNGWLMHMPYNTSSVVLNVGIHTIKIGVICKWSGTKRTTRVNDRSSNDMASSSNLIVREL